MRYELLNEFHDGFQKIKLTENPYRGIIYTYGKVEFVELSDSVQLKFEHFVLENADKVDNDFNNYVGDILQELIVEGLKNNDLIYTGGVDENRTGDPFEPDSQ